MLKIYVSNDTSMPYAKFRDMLHAALVGNQDYVDSNTVLSDEAQFEDVAVLYVACDNDRPVTLYTHCREVSDLG